ncbi:MAG: 16S rRNA methyltransferase [Rheinheimera sp.]|uniref:class I SAM-dependent methyltransferase n=1 Tax=Arsukibacterium sp. UBA3155 TaxID=1946058 RepID=UPI000C9920C9|nr:class I SAM-dependent methyltransferase [Arsukibacterium sp. UBA3155]MAD76811.1 16S rRNA methyltransferase [Rheinheimera sp.]|tara:strand:- start:82202 stop:83221 length:1020 start_codon:yes stop_codon:yes gene_type:complete
MLTNTSQMLLRNIADLTGNILIVEPEADELCRSLLANLPTDATLSCYTTNAAVASTWQHSSATCHFSALPTFNQQFDTVVIFYPKSKEQLNLTLANLAPALADNSQLYLVGDNKGGIKSLSSHADKLGLQVNKLDNAKHCLWYYLSGSLQNLAKPAFSQHKLTINSTELNICSIAGVFNHGKLDIGTALLLDNLEHIVKGTVLDFGCGSGVIGAYLKKRHNALNLYCSDVSALAAEATRQTLSANNLQGTVITADGLPAQPASFDHIVSNPPFHTGIKTDYSISEAFISQSKSRLNAGGSLTLVANSHLAYHTLLEQTFGKVAILAKANGFVIYQAIKR